MQGVINYVIFNALNRSKQPAYNFRLIDESPKGIISRKQLEFGMFRNEKSWEVRKIHSTTFLSKKGSSKFMVGGV